MLCPGTGRKRRGFSPPSSAPDFCQGIRQLRISARASRTTSRRTPRSNRGGAVHPVYAAHRRPAHWTGMLNTLTDQIHFHRRKTCSPVTMASSTTGRFSSSSSSQQGYRFPSRPGESGASGGSATSDGGGQRRTDTPRIFCHLVTDARTASCTASRTALISSSVSHFRHTGKTPAFRLPEVPAATALTAGQYQFRPGSGQSLNGGGRSGGSTPP